MSLVQFFFTDQCHYSSVIFTWGYILGVAIDLCKGRKENKRKDSFYSPIYLEPPPYIKIKLPSMVALQTRGCAIISLEYPAAQ